MLINYRLPYTTDNVYFIRRSNEQKLELFNCGAVGRSLAEKQPMDLQQLPTDRSEGPTPRATAPFSTRGGGVMGEVPPEVKRTPGLHPERPMPETKPYEKKGPTWTV
ncbi:unannotated protein [freshwater metagenome]|jgi:hypothetical protein|uniref:Unannotated protein n=1 Tax=freshwater metagenome TaxID=449393 RepID=A0A6J6I3W0_9ZZZZ